MGVELETFEERHARFTRQVFNLTASGHTEDDLLLALEQTLRQR
jgi:hypothetical protein